jgi:hypothetical protein
MAARTAGKNLRLLQEVHESLQKKMQEMFPTEASSSERDEEKSCTSKLDDKLKNTGKYSKVHERC